VPDRLRRASADAAVVAAVCVSLAVFLSAERRIAGAAGLPLDDPWIHLHFARNLVEGAGFSYNPGVPVAGSTAPLWTLLIAAGALVVGPSLALVKILGVLATLGAGMLTWRAALAWGASLSAAIGAGLGLVLSGALAWGALSGMEVSLAALLVAGALLAHAHDSPWGTALLAALAALARPEAVLLIPALLCARPITWRRLGTFLGVAAVLLLPFVIFCLMTVGRPFPATAAAKVEGGLLGWAVGLPESLHTALWQRPWKFAEDWVTWLGVTHEALPYVLGVALVAVVWRHGRRLAIPALLLVAHPLAMALLAPYREPSFQEGRYSLHLLPIAMVTLAAVLPHRFPRSVFVGVVVYLLFAGPPLTAAAERYGRAVQNINAMQVHLGHWVDERLPADARLAVNDIGAIAYFSRRHIIDLMGLVTPDILPYRREKGDGGVIRYLAETCPDHVIVFPKWFPHLTRRDDLLEAIYRVRLHHNLVAAGDEMVVYRVKRCAV
jgi:hypothetical protein